MWLIPSTSCRSSAAAECTGDLCDLADSDSGAQFSDCRQFRYALWRVWDEAPPRVMFIGLNPSTADEVHNDPTVRRCIGFAKAWGFGGLYMLNLFAFRATDPADMLAAPDPIGPENLATLRSYAGSVPKVIAAWGANAADFSAHVARVRRAIPWLWHLGLTKGGHPRHPLYLPKSATPIEWKLS